MTSKIGLIIVHGFMNGTIKKYGYDQWSLTVNVHSFIYEHRSCMINDHRHRYEHQSCMINDHRYSHEYWTSMIIDHEHNYSWSMIVAMKCYWSYMISVDQWVISWPLLPTWSPLWNLGKFDHLGPLLTTLNVIWLQQARNLERCALKAAKLQHGKLKTLYTWLIPMRNAEYGKNRG